MADALIRIIGSFVLDDKSISVIIIWLSISARLHWKQPPNAS